MTYDGIIIGAGHNSLVLQAYLCKAGLNVLCIERSSVAGGGLTTSQTEFALHQLISKALGIQTKMNQIILNRIRSFVSEENGIDENDISESSMIEGDLGIYGDDAYELLVKFGKEFNVDVSKFMAADYFSAEGSFRLPPYWRKKLNIKKPSRKELTIKHLVKAVIVGRLDESVINSED